MRRKSKETQGWQIIWCRPHLLLRRHKEDSDKPKDTQPGRGRAHWKELDSPAVTAPCALLPGLHVADTEWEGA